MTGHEVPDKGTRSRRLMTSETAHPFLLHQRQPSHATKYLKQQNARSSLSLRRKGKRTTAFYASLTILIFTAWRCWSSVISTVDSYMYSGANSYSLPLIRKPLYEENSDLDITNHPLSIYRPQNIFQSLPKRYEAPAIAIATLVTDILADASGVIDVTYRSLAMSSLQPWSWTILVVNDPDDPVRERQLTTLRRWARRDARIRVLTTPIGTSNSDGLNILLEAMLAPIGTYLAPFSMVEPTWLEKTAWSLSVVPTWDLLGHFVVMMDAHNSRVHKAGLHLGAQNLEKAQIPMSTAFRLSAVNECRFHRANSFEEQFWMFWLCFASNRRWGGTLPEVGVWRNVSDGDVNQSAPFLLDQTAATRRNLAYPKLNDTDFPGTQTTRFITLEDITWQAPFTNNLIKGQKSVMIVQNWLLVGGSEMGFLDITRYLAEAGYRITMVLNRFKYPDAAALRPLTSQYSVDIHFMPTFLRIDDFPTYVKYLIETRGIETVVMSNSQFIYDVLPGLTEQLPNVNFIDYLHNEGYDGWRNFGFPSFSLVSQRHLARTLTCSAHLKDWLVERGMPADRVGVVKLGINITRFQPRTDEERLSLRPLLPAPADDNTFVIAWTARIDNQKRPLLVPGIMRKAVDMAKERCGVQDMKILMMGDGYLKDALLSGIKAKHVEDNVYVLGTVDQPETILRTADALLLPTAMEGISIAVAEAMAIGVPIITSRIGALPELLDVYKPEDEPKGGILVDLVGDEEVETIKYAEALVELACDPDRRARLGREAWKTCQASFDHEKTLPEMIKEFALAGPNKRPLKMLPNPATYFGLHDIANEITHEIDLYSTQLKLGQALDTDDTPLGMLKKKCLLDTPLAKHWADSVLEGHFCPEVSGASPNWLSKCASEQCQSWCIWDLRTTKKDGWRWNGDCFTPFFDGDDSSEICGEWFHQKPMITYLDDGST